MSPDAATLLSPLDLVRGIDVALDAGANIIHVAACMPNRTGRADPLLERAIKRCIESNVLVVAPGGNDNGECWCFPAVLPGVLAVGALNKEGVPFKFNNRGGRYEEQCVLAPGENILGALWSGGTELQKGTSCAAPIISGIAALLMSRQLQEDGEIDAAAIRDAILRSATPCAPDEIDDERPGLAGKLNLPGAERILQDVRPGMATEATARMASRHGRASTSSPRPRRCRRIGRDRHQLRFRHRGAGIPTSSACPRSMSVVASWCRRTPSTTGRWAPTLRRTYPKLIRSSGP